MPTYEYECTKGHTFELFQRINDKPANKCPVCGARATRRISGGAGLIFKGSGFYITDYGKDGKGPQKRESADAPAAKQDSSTDAKPAAEPAKASESEPKSDKKEPDKKARKARS